MGMGKTYWDVTLKIQLPPDCCDLTVAQVEGLLSWALECGYLIELQGATVLFITAEEEVYVAPSIGGKR